VFSNETYSATDDQHRRLVVHVGADEVLVALSIKTAKADVPAVRPAAVAIVFARNDLHVIGDAQRRERVIGKPAELAALRLVAAHPEELERAPEFCIAPRHKGRTRAWRLRRADGYERNLIIEVRADE